MHARMAALCVEQQHQRQQLVQEAAYGGNFAAAAAALQQGAQQQRAPNSCQGMNTLVQPSASVSKVAWYVSSGTSNWASCTGKQFRVRFEFNLYCWPDWCPPTRLPGHPAHISSLTTG